MDTQDELMIMVGRIDANVQALLLNDVAKQKRIAALERDSWWAKGALALAAAAFAGKIRTLLGV